MKNKVINAATCDAREVTEQMLLRLRELQPEVPSWAKAEQMEISVPQTELWKYPAKATFRKHKTIRKGEAS